MEGGEKVPTSHEVQAVFDGLLEGRAYDVARECFDEHGLYLREILISTADGKTEISYMRKGRYPEGQASDTAIHMWFFDANGDAIGGHSVAKYKNGVWEIQS